MDNNLIDERCAEQMQKELLQDIQSNQEEIVTLSGEIAYVQQSPWIQNKTIRDNITYNEELDKARYYDAVESCELLRDLEILKAGDLTEIGEKGVNLSGGQKARVGLARAVYSDK